MKSRQKKVVLCVSVLGTLFMLLLLILGTRACFTNYTCDRLSEVILDDRLQFVFVFPVMLILSLITFWMKEEVFRSWAKFSLWFVPILIISTFVFSGSGDAFQSAFDGMALGLLFSIYVIWSIVRIVGTYKRTKISQPLRAIIRDL